MFKIKNIIPIALTTIAFVGCQKEININLNDSNKQLVVEGAITDDTTTAQTIRLTESANFSESNNYPTVRGAVVTVSDNAGQSAVFAETSAGVYQSTAIRGISGRTYTLNIAHNGKTYTGKSTMPQRIQLMNVLSQPSPLSPPGTTGKVYAVLPLFFDSPTLGDCYRFKLATTKKVDNSIIVGDDAQFNGKQNPRPLLSRGLTIRLGDTVDVEMQTIDRTVYDYFYALNQNVGDGPGGAATPANPKNNVSNAIGYFSAHTVQKRRVVVQ